MRYLQRLRYLLLIIISICLVSCGTPLPSLAAVVDLPNGWSVTMPLSVKQNTNLPMLLTSNASWSKPIPTTGVDGVNLKSNSYGKLAVAYPKTKELEIESTVTFGASNAQDNSIIFCWTRANSSNVYCVNFQDDYLLLGVQEVMTY